MEREPEEDNYREYSKQSIYTLAHFLGIHLNFLNCRSLCVVTALFRSCFLAVVGKSSAVGEEDHE